ncbi:MAG: hypothetical protein AB7S80_15840 [Rhizobiaceae bacterium]
MDAAAPAGGSGTAEAPFPTIAAATEAAADGAIVCVAAGTYREQLKPGEKAFTLAGGFESGSGFTVRDSAAHVSKAEGDGTGSFLRIEDPGPVGDKLTVIDGFEISGYSQAVVRDFYVSQRFSLTNNFIHGNVCAEPSLVGAGFALVNISGVIAGNVLSDNSCARGGAGAVIDNTNDNSVVVARNRIERNAGTEPDSSHGGALYLFVNKLSVEANRFIGNSVTGWGGGLYVGAYPAGGQFTNARISWNFYTGNRAGISGGGFFCDDGANCTSAHEILVANCGGNVLLDSGYQTRTITHFDHMTNIGALDVDCASPGPGVRIDNEDAADAHTITNSLFWGNAPGADLAASCNGGCGQASVAIDHSMVQTDYVRNELAVTFGPGNVAPADPLFADAPGGDYHLKSAAGRWTPSGFVQDDVTSPAIGKGTSDKPELGAYGNSRQASRRP